MSGAIQTSWPRLIEALLSGTDLTAGDTTWAMGQMMSGAASPAQVAGFLTALRAKGETVAEVRGLADTMIRFAEPITVDGPTLDIVGTGGDGAHTVNISSMAAIVAAGAGARVVKHGNRAASSSSGAADVLEALGLALDLPVERVARVAGRAGITFCFAQTFHPSMRYAAAPRRELGIRTAFNLLGPITNPARPRYSAVGAADEQVMDLIAGVFAERGTPAAVFRGDDGLDELTITTTSAVRWVRNRRVTRHTVDPRELGIDLAPAEALRGGDAAYNAQVVRDLVDGRLGPVHDAVVLNAGMALAVVGDDVRGGDTTAGTAGADGAHRRDGEDPDRYAGQPTFERALAAGMDRARTALAEGLARETLDRWIAASRRTD